MLSDLIMKRKQQMKNLKQGEDQSESGDDSIGESEGEAEGDAAGEPEGEAEGDTAGEPEGEAEGDTTGEPKREPEDAKDPQFQAIVQKGIFISNLFKFQFSAIFCLSYF